MSGKTKRLYDTGGGETNGRDVPATQASPDDPQAVAAGRQDAAVWRKTKHGYGYRAHSLLWTCAYYEARSKHSLHTGTVHLSPLSEQGLGRAVH